MRIALHLFGFFFWLITCFMALPVIAGDGLAAFLQPSSSEEEVLSPDKAFGLEVTPLDQNHLLAHFKIAQGHYLYRDRIQFAVEQIPNALQPITLPEGELKHDKNFGDMVVYHHDIEIKIPISSSQLGSAFTLTARYQGCSEKGLCYAPIHKKFPMQLNQEKPPQQNTPPNQTSTTPSTPVADDVAATSLLKSGKIWLICAGFFGFGLLLSLTPCVLPMIPILSSIIVGNQSESHSGNKSLSLSIAYVLGMAMTYTCIGILAGLSGQLLSNALQTPLVLGATAFLFAILSLSMFGFYELRMPSWLENRLNASSNQLKGGYFVSVMLMGALSALVVSPCVAAPLAGALIYISESKDVILGGMALFCLALGMGVPLLLIGASAGHLLPKVGAWMVQVRNLFGVLMLGLAIYIASPILPHPISLGLWASLLIICSIFLHALDSLPHPATAWKKLCKGFGVIMLCVGLTTLFGTVMQINSANIPPAHLDSRAQNTPSTTHSSLPFQRIHSSEELDKALQNARGKLVMLDFYADWCTACQEMEHYTFSNAKLGQALHDVVLLQADVTQNTQDDLALLKRFNLFGPPGIIFFDTQGREINTAKVIGYQNVPDFMLHVNQAIAHKDTECNPTIVC